MAQLTHWVTDLQKLLTASNITDDTRHQKAYLAHKLHSGRAKAIQKEYYRMRMINPRWQQPFGLTNVTKIGSADDPNISNESICMGKVTFPPVVLFNNRDDLGSFRIASSSKQKGIYRCGMEELFLMIESGDERLENYMFYYKSGNSYFIYPYTSQVSAELILENPMDGYRMATEVVESGNLTYEDIFVVVNSGIIYNGNVYNIGDTFTTTVAGGNSYSGPGKVKYNNQKRKMTYFDEYPMDAGMGRDVIVDLLVNEFNIERSQVTDTINDMTDQFKVLSSEGNTKHR